MKRGFAMAGTTSPRKLRPRNTVSASFSIPQSEVSKTMGREANCLCSWAEESGPCKVQLETHELIVRGTIRRRVPLEELKDISVLGDQLRFRAGQDHVVLKLGPELALSWAKKMSTPPPTLASKLGITSSSRVRQCGALLPPELQVALAQAASVDSNDPTLILAGVYSSADLSIVLARHSCTPGNPPLWVIYPKGPGHAINESEIRAALRAAGLIDTKVASVSPTHTALKFIRRA
jgi:hypothetical protein